LKLFKSYIPYLFLSLLFLVLSLIFSSSSYKKQYQSNKLEKLQEYFLNSEKQFADISHELFEQDEITLKDLAQYRESDFTILFYKNNNLEHWSTNDFVPQSQIEREIRSNKPTEEKGYFIPIENKTYFIQRYSATRDRELFYIQQLNGHPILQANSFFGNTLRKQYESSKKPQWR